MKQIINLNDWKRKEHYLFFKDHKDPFFGIAGNVDCTRTYQYAKEKDLSFFLCYMFKSLLAVNAMEAFKYRIEGGDVVLYNEIHGSTTALNANDLFAFAFLPYTDRFDTFYSQGAREIAKIKSITNMNAAGGNERLDVIHYSTIPWISFTSITQERSLSRPDSIPNIVFGKYFRDGDRILLPLSIHAHHGLMDGAHIGRYFELFEQLLNENG